MSASRLENARVQNPWVRKSHCELGIFCLNPSRIRPSPIWSAAYFDPRSWIGHTLEELEDKGITFLSMDNGDQKKQMAKEEEG